MSEELLEIANKRLIRAQFLVESRNAGVRPDAMDAAFKLADMSEVAIDDAGRVWGVDDAIEGLRKSEGYLFGNEKVDRVSEYGTYLQSMPKPRRTPPRVRR
ncbi:phage scaffolding protein [Paenibacillus odorifer]|uniref:phage scaffolding protein n=1 Tax=Paenibacillus odorifer TaxID=189426 RepID=UPI0020CBFABF|nr:hypothetical protein [Paenibacillus odorifer]